MVVDRVPISKGVEEEVTRLEDIPLVEDQEAHSDPATEILKPDSGKGISDIHLEGCNDSLNGSQVKTYVDVLKGTPTLGVVDTNITASSDSVGASPTRLVSGELDKYVTPALRSRNILTSKDRSGDTSVSKSWLQSDPATKLQLSQLKNTSLEKGKKVIDEADFSLDTAGAMNDSPVSEKGEEAISKARFDFPWKNGLNSRPVPAIPKKAVDPNSTLKRGYLTTNIPMCFWDATNILVPFKAKNNRCRVYPILLESMTGDARRSNQKFLIQKAEPGKSFSKAITFRQLSVIEGVNDWSVKEAQNHLVNEGSLALRKVIINTNNKVNPLKYWKDAMWFYRWIKVDNDNCHCVILAFIPVQLDSIPVHKPELYFAKPLDMSMQQLLTASGKLGKIVKIIGASEDQLHSIIGDELFEGDPSPARPATKKFKQGDGTEKVQTNSGTTVPIRQ